MTKTQVNKLEYILTGACIEVHKYLGPGLLETVYHQCLLHELHLQNISFESEKNVDVEYKGFILNTNLRVDVLVENCILLELKSVAALLPIHEAQVISYMKLAQVPKGMLINFNCKHIISEGKKVYVNQYFSSLLSE